MRRDVLVKSIFIKGYSVSPKNAVSSDIAVYWNWMAYVLTYISTIISMCSATSVGTCFEATHNNNYTCMTPVHSHSLGKLKYKL